MTGHAERESAFVHAQRVTPPRVLLANLEPMARLGMRRVLAEGGIEVVGDEENAGGVVGQVGRLLPDAVVLGFDGKASLELSERVRTVAPETKVILWTRDESAMDVFDPGSAEPRRIHLGASNALLRELSTDQSSSGGE